MIGLARAQRPRRSASARCAGRLEPLSPPRARAEIVPRRRTRPPCSRAPRHSRCACSASRNGDGWLVGTDPRGGGELALALASLPEGVADQLSRREAVELASADAATLCSRQGARPVFAVPIVAQGELAGAVALLNARSRVAGNAAQPRDARRPGRPRARERRVDRGSVADARARRA